MPAIACKDGKPSILYGTQGGEGQPQTQTAIITRMIDYEWTHKRQSMNRDSSGEEPGVKIVSR